MLGYIQVQKGTSPIILTTKNASEDAKLSGKCGNFSISDKQMEPIIYQI